jgi:hypothetical protein
MFHLEIVLGKIDLRQLNYYNEAVEKWEKIRENRNWRGKRHHMSYAITLRPYCMEFYNHQKQD